MSQLLERFLRYVAMDTRSDDSVMEVPSTKGQRALAVLLAEEMTAMGMTDVYVCPNSFVYGTLESNVEGNERSVCLMAHLDTYPGFSGAQVKPVIHTNYQGGVLTLNPDKQTRLDPKLFPEMLRYVGHDLITTDGTTLLGADDKGGIAEILTAVERLMSEPDRPHCRVQVIFTPDEETDKGGMAFLDEGRYSSDFVLTVDGDGIGEINVENFNAASAKVLIHGLSVHTGEGKGKMVNAGRIAAEFATELDKMDTPEHSEGYEGFIHVDEISGNVDEAHLYCLIRAFDTEGFENRKSLLVDMAERYNRRYGQGTVEIHIRNDYKNMRECIQQRPWLVEVITASAKDAGVEPKLLPIRGGTDGALLAERGIPAPNLFIGGHNYHGEYEFVSLQAMEAAVSVIVALAERLSGQESYA